MDKSTLFGHQY